MGILNVLRDLLTSQIARRLLSVVVVWLIVYILIRYLSSWIKEFSRKVFRVGVNIREMKALERLLDYVIVITGIIVTLAILNLTQHLYGILTTMGIIGIIIGFAVKDIAANFISGIFILLDRPFVTGDFIEVGSHRGMVERISLRSTQILTFDGSMVSIPNNKLATTPIVNYSASPEMELELIIPLSDEKGLKKAEDVIQSLLKSEREKYIGEPLITSSEGEDGIYLSLKLRVPSTFWFTLASDLRRKAQEELSSLSLAGSIRLTPDIPSTIEKERKG